MKRIIAALIGSLLLVGSAHGILVIGSPGLNISGGGACTLWNPSNASVLPVEVFDPSTFTYSGSNFTSGSNSGTGAGNWVLNSGTLTKGTPLNGVDVVSFTGAQEVVNTTSPWPGGNVYIFMVAKVSTTQSNSLVSASWAVGEGRDATHGWSFYPRGGSAFGGSANEAWLFQGTGAAVITRGDLFTDTNYHIAAIKMGTSVDLRKDGTAGSPSSVTGTINATSTSEVRVGSSGPSGAEALTGSVAYLAVLVNPTADDITNFEGWAAWRFGLQANLPGGHPDAGGPPCAGGPAPGCTVSPCDPAPLTWTQIQADSGTLANRQPIMANGYGTPQDIGIYPFGINGFSWELGGDEYLGDPARPNAYQCGTVKPFKCIAMTSWHIVYHEAATLHGTEKPSVVGINVFYRNYQAWCHLIAGGWTKVQDAPTSHGLTTGVLSPKQDAGFGAASTTDLGGGNYVMPGPPAGKINHGWPQDRGAYTVDTVDHCYAQYEIHVDQPNGNLLAALGIDWWQFPGSGTAPTNNTGYSQTIWVRITPDWTRITNTSMSLAALKADPPPPLVGIGP